MLYDNQFCLATMTLYFSAVWTQSGESGNTLKIKCSGTADERANIFAVPTTPEVECSSRCSVSDIMPYSYQASLPQRRFSGAVAHDFGSFLRKQKAPEVSPRQCVRDISRMAETEALFTIARRRCRNAHYLFQ